MDTSSLINKNNIRILEILVKSGDIYQKEMAKKVGISDAGMKIILEKLENADIISTYLDRDNGRVVKKITLNLNPDVAKKLIKNYRQAQSTLKNAIAALRKPKLE
jgi:predicted ArsR family transcriptional regulator